MKLKNITALTIILVTIAFFSSVALETAEEEKKEPQHPYDLYDHDMHNQIFQGASVSCEICHADPESYEKRGKISPDGCHKCHKDPNPIIQATNRCDLCHLEGIPRPRDHTVDWIEKHYPPAKQNPDSCMECHYKKMSCFDCHESKKTVKEKRKDPHPYNFFDHAMHLMIFESSSVSCKVCHSDPQSFKNRKKVEPLGCHRCHNDEKPIVSAAEKCTICHVGGPPKPQSHKVGWGAKHQVYAKTNPKECLECHTNQMFCIDCHKKRDTVRERVHRRNFKFFHSIDARANPRKCDACHTVNYCQQCHAGRGSSKL